MSQRHCWKCGETIPTDRYCETCGADQWNPPQGMAATRHAEAASAHITAVVPALDPLALAGIVIAASMTAFACWSVLALVVIGLVNEPYGTFREGPRPQDYVAGWRVFAALLAGAALTVGTWFATLNLTKSLSS